MSAINETLGGQLGVRCARRAYLVTYSQANLNTFPTREAFGNAVEEAFNSGSSKVKVNYWACCLEEHGNGGHHYHASVKLTGPKRWSSVKAYLLSHYDIRVHFGDGHDNYYAAYRYVTKSDENVFLSEDHPNLRDIGTPRTTLSTQAYRAKRKSVTLQEQSTSSQSVPPENRDSKKCKRLSNVDVAEFLVENGIKTEIELFAAANDQKQAGKKDLANFILSRNSKSLGDLIKNTWKMENSKSIMDKQTQSRMEIIYNYAMKECDDSCQGEWLRCAKEVLRQNKIETFDFSSALRQLLSKGRGKQRNVLIVGPANCGKTFLLRPLEILYDTFCNPSNDKYAWLGVQDAQAIFLNDFRWSSDMIAWRDLLNLLEGLTVHLPSPKNHFTEDIIVKEDTPIFATSKSRIRYIGKYNVMDEREDEMMAVRWKVFDFKHQIPLNEQKDIAPCGKCFASLVLERPLFI